MTPAARRLDEIGRRAFLQRVAATTLGVAGIPWLTRLPANEPGAATFARPRARKVINLFMAGGMSHLDTFDPKPAAVVGGQPGELATAVDGLRLGQRLPQLAGLADRLCVVRSLSTTQGAHEQGQYFMRTGYVKRGTIRHPSLGGWIHELGGRHNRSLPGSVVIGGGSDHPGAGFMQADSAPLMLGAADDGLPHASPHHSIDEDRHRRRLELMRELEAALPTEARHRGHQAYQALYRDAVQLMQSRDLAAFDIASEDDRVAAAYGESRFGLGCLLARRLVEHDVRYVEVTQGGWDTHNDHDEALDDRVPTLDRVVATLLRDLERRGLLEETVVMITTEFGRTPKLNQNRGRDHHPKAFSCVLAGAGIKAGHVHGATDERGDEVTTGRVGVPDLHATVGHLLGFRHDQVVTSPSGRPFTIGDKGRPLAELLA